MANFLDEFRAAMNAHGFQPPPQIVADGTIHRFSREGRPDDTSAWYCCTQHASGHFGDWRTGESHRWRGRRGAPHNARALHVAHQTQQRQQMAARQQRWREAQSRAYEIWAAAEACSTHPYLAAKQIGAHGCRVSENYLLVPLIYAGQLWSILYIDPAGRKRFMKGGRVKECHRMIGQFNGSAPLLVAEGFATAASLHEATGYPTVVAFSASNLKPVAQHMRKRYPDKLIILCADNDYGTPGNPGLRFAREAALAVDGLITLPPQLELK